jgi:hypothetical protein
MSSTGVRTYWMGFAQRIEYEVLHTGVKLW